MDELTWSCHICGRVRADQEIGVFTRDISERYQMREGTMKMNTRYCLDSVECKQGAEARKDFNDG